MAVAPGGGNSGGRHKTRLTGRPADHALQSPAPDGIILISGRPVPPRPGSRARVAETPALSTAGTVRRRYDGDRSLGPLSLCDRSAASHVVRAEDPPMSKRRKRIGSFTNDGPAQAAARVHPRYRVDLHNNATQALMFVVQTVMELTRFCREEATHKMWE